MKYKPNLIKDIPKDGSVSRQDVYDLITKRGGIENYVAFKKKDGCRLAAGVHDHLVTRSLKKVKSIPLNERFAEFNALCRKLNIIVDGEFYMHGLKFNEINRFFTKSDVRTPEYRKELENLLEKRPETFYNKYRGRGIEFLTEFHGGLQFWAFDFIILGRPDLVRFIDRWKEAKKRFADYDLRAMSVMMPAQMTIGDFPEMERTYERVLEQGWEGLVLTHKDHVYKFGRSTYLSGDIIKLKDDMLEYDGVILYVEEATEVKEGVAKTTNELGRSVTSKKKGDRIPSGLAKGFRVEFEGLGTFPVGLRGFDNIAKKFIWDNKEDYVGRHFKYTGMKPVKDFPRHAYFDTWRDEK